MNYEDLVNIRKHQDREIFAKAAAEALCDIGEDESPQRIIDMKKALIKNNGDNIIVKNSLKYLIHNIDKKDIKGSLVYNKGKLFSLFKKNNSGVYKHIKQKTKTGKNIFVHSLNGPLSYSILQLLKQGKYNVCAPKHTSLHAGKKYLGSKVKYIDDLDIYRTILSSDFVFIGADLISKKHIVSKKGTRMCADIANKHNKPVYICGTSFYLDYHNTHTTDKFGKHYEKTDLREFTGIISEVGIHKPKHFIDETSYYNSWLTNKDL